MSKHIIGSAAGVFRTRAVRRKVAEEAWSEPGNVGIDIMSCSDGPCNLVGDKLFGEKIENNRLAVHKVEAFEASARGRLEQRGYAPPSPLGAGAPPAPMFFPGGPGPQKLPPSSKGQC